MPITEGVVYCDGCGVEIPSLPVVQQGLGLCCSLCAQGGECGCGVENEERCTQPAPVA